MDEWDKKKNKGINPRKMLPRSNVNVWWKCKNCGYEWQAPIDRRAKGAGCPYCTHEVVWVGHNDVETLRPDLLDDWDYDENTITPRDISQGSDKLISWKCSKCGYKWKSTMHSRSKGHGCPMCARKTVSLKLSKKVINLDTNQIYMSVKEASEKTGILQSNITRVCRGEGKKAGGFHWAYIKNDSDQ